MADKIATREAYGKALVDLGNENGKVVVLDADLAGATMTKYFKAAHPDRFFDMGIAEADMVATSAGLSTMGLIPYCSTFAMFGAGRAYDQMRNSVAYPHFNVKLCCSHAGVSVGEDGGSHQCIEDLALMRAIPGMTVIVPADAKEARKAVFALAEYNGPSYLRLARLATPVFEEDYPFEIGKANVLREGTDVAIFACGLMVSESLEAAKLLEAEGIHAAVINVHTIKPIDAQCVTEWAGKCGKVITVEEHSTIGGLGDAVADVLMGKVACQFHKIGVRVLANSLPVDRNFTEDFVASRLSLPPEEVREILTELYELHFLRRGEIQGSDGIQYVYSCHDETLFVPFLYFAGELMKNGPEVYYSVPMREGALFHDPLGENALSPDWSPSQKRSVSDIGAGFSSVK